MVPANILATTSDLCPSVRSERRIKRTPKSRSDLESIVRDHDILGLRCDIPAFHLHPARFEHFNQRRASGSMSSAQFAFLAGHERNIVVFPKHGQNLFPAVARCDFYMHKECRNTSFVL